MHVCAVVHARAGVQVSMCVCAQVCGDQRKALDVVPQVQSTFFFETGFLTGL